MAKMKAVQMPKAGADFEIVEREIPQPGAGQVRIRVEACGVCHSDVLDVDPVNDPSSRAEKQFLRKSPKVNRRDNK